VPHGGVKNVKDTFGDPSSLRKLDQVLTAVADRTQTKVERRVIVEFVQGLIQFSEDALGSKSAEPRPCMRIPAKLLLDLRPMGGLQCLLEAAHKFLGDRGFKCDFQDPANRDYHIALVKMIRQMLGARFLLPRYEFHIAYLSAADQESVKETVALLGAKVVEGDDEGSATHVVYPTDTHALVEGTDMFCRTLEKKGEKSRVHWWYRPDSYDEWVPNENVNGEPVEPDNRSGPFRIEKRFVDDSKSYNEWMNELDYEADEKAIANAPLAKKRPAVNDPAMGDHAAKKQKDLGDDDGKGAEVQAPGNDHPGVGTEVEPNQGQLISEAPKVVEQQIKEAHQSVQGLISLDQDLLQSNKRPAAGSPLPTIQNLSQAVRAPKGKDGNGPVSDKPPGSTSQPAEIPNSAPTKALKSQEPVEQVLELYRVPAHSSWFSWDKIHDIEKRHLPEFFTGKSSSKTPKTYLKFRNFIIDKFRENTTRRITFTECRQCLAGDVSAIQRVHAFLDSWGLINFMAPEDAKLRSVPPKVVPHSEPDPEGMRTLAPEVGQPATASLFTFPAYSAQPAGVRAHETTPPSNKDSSIPALAVRRNVFDRVATLDGPTRYVCNVTGKDCTDIRYHCLKQPDCDLHPDAFFSGQLPPGTSSADFVRVEKDQKDPGASDWSDQETLLLLEALEMYGDKWEEVVEHVGTKSKAECVAHFLRMPIEDEFLEEIENYGVMATKGGPGYPTGKQADGMFKENVPFSEAENPIMAQVAFLAAMVGPKVAAAAAQAALMAISQEDPTLTKDADQAIATTASVDTEPAASGASGKAGEGEDASGDARPMEVDVAGISAAKTEEPSTVKGDDPVSLLKVKTAAATALAAAAVKAKLLADQEEREIKKLVVQAVEVQVKRMEHKLQHLEEIQKLMERERQQMEKERILLQTERIRFTAEKLVGQTLAGNAGAVQAAPMSSEANASKALPGSVPPPTSQPSPAARNPMTNPTAPVAGLTSPPLGSAPPAAYGAAHPVASALPATMPPTGPTRPAAPQLTLVGIPPPVPTHRPTTPAPGPSQRNNNAPDP